MKNVETEKDIQRKKPSIQKSIGQIPIFAKIVTQVMPKAESAESLTWSNLLQRTLISTLDQISRRLYWAPPPRKNNSRERVAAWLLKREWLLIITCGTIIVPTAFYVASTIEHVSIVEYTRLATLSWLSFFAGAVLNRLRK